MHPSDRIGTNTNRRTQSAERLSTWSGSIRSHLIHFLLNPNEDAMKAMILAAGKGTRVRPLTYDLPKPMIPIFGKPVMAYLIEHLAKFGVTDIMVKVSYLH